MPGASADSRKNTTPRASAAGTPILARPGRAIAGASAAESPAAKSSATAAATNVERRTQSSTTDRQTRLATARDTIGETSPPLNETVQGPEPTSAGCARERVGEIGEARWTAAKRCANR